MNFLFLVQYFNGDKLTEHTLPCSELKFWFHATTQELYIGLQPVSLLNKISTLIDLYTAYLFRC